MNRLQLRAWRRQRWLTQTQLAELLGINMTTVQRWENGFSTVPPYLPLALAHLDSVRQWSPEGADPRLLRGVA